jgi:general secretion pathway protein E
MPTLLTQAEAVFLVSVFKPIVMAIVFGCWAWVVSNFDKDLARHFLKRQLWNGVQLGCAAGALVLWLLIPLFWLGLPVAVVILGGGIGAYIWYRNGQVAEKDQWEFNLNSFREKMSAAEHARAQTSAGLLFLTAAGVRKEVPAGQDPLVPVHAKFAEVMDFTLSRGGDRIDIAAAAQQAVIVAWVDGVKYPQRGVNTALAISLIDYLKKQAGLNIEDRRHKQAGNTIVESEVYDRHVLGLNTSGTTREVSLSVRIDPDKRFSANYDALGLLEPQRAALQAIFDKPRGVVLVSCPPRNGLTTTLYSLTQKHDPYTQSIMSLEDEIAFPLEGASQQVIEPGADIKWINTKLTELLRKDPQVLMVSRITDASVAQLVAAAGEECRIYAGINLDDTFSGLRGWIKAVGDPKAAAQHLRAIVAQRLVRKLCITCRMPFTPDPAAVKKLNLPADRVTQFYKESGNVVIKNKPQPCPACQGMAYRGRVAVFEAMVLDDNARKLIAAGQLDQLRGYLRKQKMLWLQEAALAKVIDGTTSITEITRALSKEKG